MDRDPLVTQFISGPWSAPEEHRAFVLSRMNCEYPKGFGYWSVFEKEEPQEFLGWILLLPYQAVKDEAEIGWRFVRKSWGRGYASESASAVLHHAFRRLRLDYVVADIDPRNVASIRVAEKLGMHFTGDRMLEGVLAKSYRMRSEDM